MSRSRTSLALGAVLAIGAVSPGALHAADPPVTLRFAVADGEGRPSDPYVRAFAAEVAERSGGSVTVEILWDAGADTDAGFEQGVAGLLVEGRVDLALSAGRAWHSAGVSSLQALQAPFLIDSDALAIAVATDPLADGLLASMADAGVTGLALWPEDLRHPVAFEPCIGPITIPDQLRGTTVRAIPSAITIELIEALGATHTWVDGYDALVERCEIQAAESGFLQGASLPGLPTFTGDVTFFPKYQVLAANGGTFGHLAAQQQDAVRTAALAVRDRALRERPSDADAATEWCADGGAVVLAGDAGTAAFEAAVEPVHQRLDADPVLAPFIAAIRELRSTTPRPDLPDPCSPLVVAPEASPAEPAMGEVALPATGAWRIVHTVDTLMANGLSRSEAGGLVGATTIEFDGSSWSGIADCGGAYRLQDGYLHLEYERNPADCGTLPLDLRWVPAGPDRARVETAPGTGDVDRALFTGEWFRID